MSNTITSTNPATGESCGRFDELSDAELDARITAAELAYRDWRATPLDERARLVRRVGEQLVANRAEHAGLMTAEMGKPIAQARAEVEKCATGCDFYADHAAEFLAPRHTVTDARSSYVRRDPIGGVFAIMPWNFPYWQVLRCAAPAIVAGNVLLLKHAGNVSGCALAIERAFHEAGVPEGVFTTLLITSQRVPKVVEHPFVRGVSLTGSEGAGRAVAACAGKALVRTVLELGGSDPFVVLEDADLEHTIPQAVRGRTINGGQSCIAAKRFLVHRSVLDRFTDGLVAGMQALVVGDPNDESTDVGPLAKPDLVETLDEQVRDSVAAGAVARTGGEPLDRTGCFYPPTVLTNVDPSMRVFAEETFGPVAAIVPFDTEEEALDLANASPYGLGASVWTADTARGERLAERIDSGSVFVNGITRSDPRLPFGGVKASGYGRELAEQGIREFVNEKTVWVA